MNDTTAGPRDDPGRYEIRLRGRLQPRWSGWFDGMTLTDGHDGTTVIVGSVVDQAALQGLLRRVHDLGVPLISVTRIDSTDSPAST